MLNNMMKEFHETYEVEKFDLTPPTKDMAGTEEMSDYLVSLDKFITLRNTLMLEEMDEFATGSRKLLESMDQFEDTKAARVEMLDGLADMIYIIAGTAHLLGMDIDKALNEVHRSNMTKLGEDGKPLRSDGTDGKPKGKVLKGPNFEEPKLEEYV